MGATYEFWLCDDSGKRICLLSNIDFASYSRSTSGYGTIQIGLPYQVFSKLVGSQFKPDWRIDVWRAPITGIISRREGSFLLRKPQIYQRTEDSMNIIELFGRSPLDLLRRQHYKGAADITDNIDDIMKTIVRAQFVNNLTAYSTTPLSVQGGVYTSLGEFAVDGDAGEGPTVTDNFYLKNVLDICQDLKKASIALNGASSTNKKIYFDVVEDNSIGLSGGFGYRFRTYPTLRGMDRTAGIQFSVENGNMDQPVYSEDYLDEWTSVFKYNNDQAWASQNAQSSEKNLSRWNYIEKAETTSDDSAAVALNDVYATLRDGAAKISLNANFLNTPGSNNNPRSLYGVDWDLGDLLPCKFADRVINAEVAIVYVAVNDQGQETITGQTTVGT